MEDNDDGQDARDVDEDNKGIDKDDIKIMNV